MARAVWVELDDQLAKGGDKGFYEGRTADLIVAQMGRGPAKGLITDIECEARDKEQLDKLVAALRAKGLAAVQKKSSRTAAEGLVGVAVAGTRGVAVEVNSETDFVAKNDQFQDFVRNVTEIALANGDDVEALAGAAYPAGGTVAEKLTSNIATIGENQTLRRAKVLKVEQGTIVAYVHNAVATGLGKIGVLVALESAAPADKLEALGKQLAMHVAAAFPLALDESGIPADVIDRERKIAQERQPKAASRLT